MSQLTDNLNLIVSIKSDIKSAIENKGVDMTGVSFGSFADKIGEITTSFVTVPLSVSVNGTYTPGQGVDGYSQVVVDVPQSVTGFTEKEVTEGIRITNLNNSASYVHSFVYEKDTYLQTVNLPNCTIVYDNAFTWCPNLTTVSLPVCQVIYEKGFQSCTKLQSLYVPNVSLVAPQAFAQCGSLSTLNFPALQTVGSSAFEQCTRLQEINLPNIKEITGFKSCTSLTSVSLPECITLNGNAFENCTALSSIYLPKVTRINSYAFQSCSYLISVNIPECYYIGGSVFRSCTNLTDINMPNLVELAGNLAFEHCHSIQSLHLSKFARFTGTWNFNDCSSLSIVDLPNLAFCANGFEFERDYNLKELYINSETYVVPYCFLSRNTNTGITSIYTHINNVSRFISASGWSYFSDKIIGIGDSTVSLLNYSDGVLGGETKVIEGNFYNYLNMTAAQAQSDITSINLPNCYYIDTYTFRSYRSITDLSLPMCEYIYSSAFANCTGLTYVNLPKCKYIGVSAFYNGNYSIGLTLTLGSTQVVRNDGAFANTTMRSIYVPASLVDAYKSAPGWSYLSSKIFPISE